MEKLHIMYSENNVFYAVEKNGEPLINLNYTAKIGEWLIRFIENDADVVPVTPFFTRKSPYDMLEYPFDEEPLKEHYRQLLDTIFCYGVEFPTLEGGKDTKPSPIEMLRFTDEFRREYKIKHMIINVEDNKYIFAHDYIVESLPEALSVELILLFERGILLKKCDNCGKYFFPKDSTEKYCDRLVNSNKSCKDIGYICKVQKDEFLRLYNTAYKTKHMQKQRHTRNKSKSTKDKYEAAFKKWHFEAREYLEKARKGEITLEEFEKFLNKRLEVD